MKFNKDVGNVWAAPTPSGYIMFQTTHIDSDFGELVRLIPGVKKSTIAKGESLKSRIQSITNFVAFLPAYELAKKGSVVFLAKEEVPQVAKEFPTMKKMRNSLSSNGNPLWSIWNGTTDRPVDHLTDEDNSLPVAMIMPLKKFVERALRFQGLPMPSAEKQPPKTYNSAITHLCYFSSISKAQRAARQLDYYRSEIIRSTHNSWLLKLHHDKLSNIEEFGDVENDIEQTINQCGGDYDGWEAKT